MIIHSRRAEALRSVGRLRALADGPRYFDDGSSELARRGLAERLPVPQAVRLASPDGPRRRSTARRYIG